MSLPMFPKGHESWRDGQTSKACRRCGHLFTKGKPSATSRGEFCSRQCQYAYRKETNPHRAKPCPVCGKSVGRDSRYAIGQKTCSAACGYLYRKLRMRSERRCDECGRAYFPERKIRLKFCSRACMDKARGRRPAFIEALCLQCGVKFRRTSAAVRRTRRTFCSRACSAMHMRGEGSAMHRPGKREETRGPGWTKLAERIRERDGFACRRCGKSQDENKRKLSVDHIRPWRSFQDKTEANHPDNLAALCNSCHSFKTSKVEQAWIRGDVIAMRQWIASISMPSLNA